MEARMAVQATDDKTNVVTTSYCMARYTMWFVFGHYPPKKTVLPPAW